MKQGDLLAEIETPELDQQLQQARADLETAQANHDLAQTTADRWQFLLKSGSVSPAGDRPGGRRSDSAKGRRVESNSANVHRLEDLQSFEKVYAPFDGVITARNTDVGELINAGAGRAGAGAVPPGRDRQAARLRRGAEVVFAGRADRAPRHR